MLSEQLQTCWCWMFFGFVFGSIFTRRRTAGVNKPKTHQLFELLQVHQNKLHTIYQFLSQSHYHNELWTNKRMNTFNTSQLNMQSYLWVLFIIITFQLHTLTLAMNECLVCVAVQMRVWEEWMDAFTYVYLAWSLSAPESCLMFCTMTIKNLI